MLNQQSYQFGSQRKCTPFGVLNVLLPGIFPILFRENINRHTSEIDIAPSRVQKFPTSQAGTQAHTNEQLPFDRRAFLFVLLGKPTQAITFLLCEHADLPSWRLWWFQSAMRVTVKLSTIFRQLEYPFQLLDLLRNRARRDVLLLTVLNESLTVLIGDCLHIDISSALGKIFHGPRPVHESRDSNLSLHAQETILEEVRQSH